MGWITDTRPLLPLQGPDKWWSCCKQRFQDGIQVNAAAGPHCLSPRLERHQQPPVFHAHLESSLAFLQEVQLTHSPAAPRPARPQDNTCPPRQCGLVTPKSNQDDCCNYKGEGGRDLELSSCPLPPLRTVTHRKGAAALRSSTQRSPRDGELANLTFTSQLKFCTGLFTDDMTCPLVVCYHYDELMNDVRAIQANTTAFMSQTANATEVRAVGCSGWDGTAWAGEKQRLAESGGRVACAGG